MSYNSELQSNNADLQTILNMVNALPDANGSGGVELPELENPATAADMVLGKSLYDSDGNLVTGNVIEVAEGSLFTAINPSELYFINNKIRVTGVANINSRYDGALLRTGSNPRLFIEASEFGNATRDDVKEGVFFTSSAGLLVEGRHKCNGGVTLPDLGDTAAQPTDIVAGKVLYDDKGNPVTGTLLEANEIQEKSWATSNYSFGGTAGGTTFNVSGMYNGSSGVPDGLIVRPGAGLGVRNAPTDFFGDATAADVAKGKKFTSAAGLLVEGTLAERKPGDEGRYIFRTNARVSGGTGLFVEAESSPSAASIIHRPGSTATIQISSGVFGNAAADQVAKGATFTSEVGLLTEGELEEILAGASIGSNEDISVKRYDNGTIRIIGKTNWGDNPDCIVRSGAYLNITAKESDFDGIFGSGVDASVDGETLVITGAVIVDNETLIL